MNKTKKGLLLILDGYGEGPRGEYNAVENANTPFLKKIKNEMPNCLIRTDGRFVGLPDGTMGGSEVGHMAIGAGRAKRSMQVIIEDEIENGNFFKRKELMSAFSQVKKNNGAIHIGGLWSDKKVHSDLNHCFALMRMAQSYEIKKVFIHAFTDGRDCTPRSCMEYFKLFNIKSKEYKVGEIATIGGRFYIMDRENNLDRTKLAIDKILQTDYDYNSVDECIVKNYEENTNDEFFVPARIKTKNEYKISDNDLFIFFNTRADRMKQPVSMASEILPCPILTFCDFIENKNVRYIYDEDYIDNTLSEYLSKLGKKQLKISESTKYAHVTYFFNGGKEEAFLNEDRIHVMTQKTQDYALTPYMKAKEITDEAIKAINKNKYDAIVINFSNPDMVGHTGNYEATIIALVYLDKCVEQIITICQKKNISVLMCADHGNAESMRDSYGNPQTSHTLNPVKCVIIDKDKSDIKMHNGSLQDIAPTFLKLLNIEQNPSFVGKPLY